MKRVVAVLSALALTSGEANAFAVTLENTQLLSEASAAILAMKEDGALAGFEIDVALLMAERLGYGIKFTDMEFGALIAALASGKVDMIGANMAVTDERKESVAFLEPNYYDGIVAVVPLPKEG